MQPLNCFYLHNTEAKEHESTDLVLNCDSTRSCGLEEFVWDDKDQMFWWDKPEGEDWGNLLVFDEKWDVKDRRYLFVDDHNNLGTTGDS